MKKNTPICKKKPELLSIHNQERIDDYYWLNDRENPEVINYLNSENSYTDSQMKNTESFQKTLFNELKSRITAVRVLNINISLAYKCFLCNPLINSFAGIF